MRCVDKRPWQRNYPPRRQSFLPCGRMGKLTSDIRNAKGSQLSRYCPLALPANKLAQQPTSRRDEGANSDGGCTYALDRKTRRLETSNLESELDFGAPSYLGEKVVAQRLKGTAGATIRRRAAFGWEGPQEMAENFAARHPRPPHGRPTSSRLQGKWLKTSTRPSCFPGAIAQPPKLLQPAAAGNCASQSWPPLTARERRTKDPSHLPTSGRLGCAKKELLEWACQKLLGLAQGSTGLALH
jgi:hypothetical protein